MTFPPHLWPPAGDGEPGVIVKIIAAFLAVAVIATVLMGA